MPCSMAMSLCSAWFFLLSMGGTALVVASKSTFSVWCGMELSFFGAMPLLVGSTVYASEAGFKYFFVQVVGSSLMASCFFSVMGGASPGYFMMIFLMAGLFLKVGIFPFHSWFPSVVGGSSWSGSFILMLLQKVGPYWFVSGAGLPSCVMFYFILCGVVTSWCGALGGLNQSTVRGLLGYSSLSHSGWLLNLCLVDLEYFLIYFSIYGSILSFLLIRAANPSGSFFMGLYFISLGGLPPLLGSVSKLMGMKCLVEFSPFISSLLVVSSMVSMAYYVWMLIRLALGAGPIELKCGKSGVIDSLINLLTSPSLLLNSF